MKKVLRCVGLAAVGFVAGFTMCIYLYSELEKVVDEQDDCDEFECTDL